MNKIQDLHVCEDCYALEVLKTLRLKSMHDVKSFNDFMTYYDCFFDDIAKETECPVVLKLRDFLFVYLKILDEHEEDIMSSDEFDMDSFLRLTSKVVSNENMCNQYHILK